MYVSQRWDVLGQFMKAEQQSDVRWITLHPHDDERYVRVKIRMNSDGSANVISGADGVRGLKLNKLNSPAVWQENAKRRQALRAAKKQEDADRKEAEEQRKRKEAEEDPQKAHEYMQEQKRKREEEDERKKRITELHHRKLETLSAIAAKAEEMGIEGFKDVRTYVDSLRGNPGLSDALSADLQAVQEKTSLPEAVVQAAADPQNAEQYADELAEHGLTPENIKWLFGDKDLRKGHKPPKDKQEQLKKWFGDALPVLKEALKSMRGGENMFRSAQIRKAVTGASRFARNLMQEIVENHDLRTAIAGEGGAVSAEALSEKPRVGKGFAAGKLAEAEARGISEGDIKATIEEVRQDQIDRLMESDNPEDQQKAAAKIEARRTLQQFHAIAHQLKVAGDGIAATPEAKLPPAEIAQHAKKVTEALALQKELDELLRLERSLTDSSDLPKSVQEALKGLDSPSPVRVEAKLIDPKVVAEIMEDVEELERSQLTYAFLEQVEGQGEGQGLAMARHKLKGSYDAGSHAVLSTALVVGGRTGIDRMVHEVLGPELTAKVAAQALAQKLAPEELEVLKEALQQHHEKSVVPAMQKAMEYASEAEAAAASIEIPEVSDGATLGAASEAARLRQSLLEEAMDVLGTAFGQLETGALFNTALSKVGSGNKPINATFSADTPAAKLVQGLAALGLLRHEHYSLEKDDETNQLLLQLPPETIGRLVSPQSGAEAFLEAEIDDIKQGRRDEEDWLPAGFVRYPMSMQREAQFADPLAAPLGFEEGLSPSAAVERYVKTRLQDGWLPADIAQALRSADHIVDHVPDEHLESYLQEVSRLFPLERLMKEDGSTGGYRDFNTDPELQQRYQALLGDSEDGVHTQSIGDGPEVQRAAYLAAMSDPRLTVGFKDPSNLSYDDQSALRSYFYSEIVKINPDQAVAYSTAHAKSKAQAFLKYGGKTAAKWRTVPLDEAMADPEFVAAVKAHKEEPFFEEPNMFGEVDKRENPIYKEYQAAIAAGVEEHLGPAAWEDYVRTMRGTDKAYVAMQEHMRGTFAERFHKHHGNFTGKPLRLGKAAISFGDRIEATLDKEARTALLGQEARSRSQVQNRIKGKYAEDSKLMEKTLKDLRERKAAKQAQGALFGDLQPIPEETGMPALTSPQKERITLGRRAEAELGNILPYLTQNTRATDRAPSLFPGLTMGKGTKFAVQQRAIKFAVAGRKTYGALGMGSGKTGLAIGTFTQLHSTGQAKKALFLVPSAVRSQFGGEMASFTEPGKYRFHARDASHEERLGAMRDPSYHMVVTTHQAFRDDMVKLMAKHHGFSEDGMAQAFMAADPDKRKDLLQQALHANNLHDLLDFIAVDEGHNLSNREGKPDAVMAAIADAALDLAPRALMASGTPAKNDTSEVFDMLGKLDRRRFGNYQAFKRSYGVDLPLMQDAFKRMANRYIFASSVKSGAPRTDVWGARDADGKETPLALHPEQERQLGEVNEAYQRARQARRNGTVDVDALRILSPNSFKDLSPEQAQAKAEELSKAIGTLQEAARSRVLDLAPPEQNAKVQHLLKLARERKGKPGIVFAHSLQAVEMLQQQLAAEGLRVATVTGKHSSDDKDAIRQQFQSGEHDVLVMSDAGAVGMNLQRGQWLAHYDLPMTHATLAQRSARIDRIGQKNAVEIHHLVTDTDYDRRARKRLTTKGALQQVFESDWSNLDDTGLAKEITEARKRRAITPEDIEAAA